MTQTCRPPPVTNRTPHLPKRPETTELLPCGDAGVPEAPFDRFHGNMDWSVKSRLNRSSSFNRQAWLYVLIPPLQHATGICPLSHINLFFTLVCIYIYIYIYKTPWSKNHRLACPRGLPSSSGSPSRCGVARADAKAAVHEDADQRVGLHPGEASCRAAS